MPDLLPRTVPASASPPALRPRRPSWRDPRLVLGLVLVCVSVLAGARILDGADETVAVLAVRGPVAAGQRLESAGLATVRVRFAEEADADRYLPAGSDLGDAVARRPLGAGELLPRHAVGGGSPALLELPLTLRPGRVPSAVTVGTTVDVWSADPGAGASADPADADLLLSDVPVLAAARSAGAAAGMRQVVVGVAPTEERRLGAVVARLSEERLLLVRRPG